MSASHAAQVRQQLQAFTLGGITALYFGYVRVSHDVWSAAEAVDSKAAADAAATAKAMPIEELTEEEIDRFELVD